MNKRKEGKSTHYVKEMAILSSILTEKLNEQKEGRKVNSLCQRNGNPLQYSCLENPMEKEPCRLQSLGLRRVRHDLATEHNLVNNTAMYIGLHVSF